MHACCCAELRGRLVLHGMPAPQVTSVCAAGLAHSPTHSCVCDCVQSMDMANGKICALIAPSDQRIGLCQPQANAEAPTWKDTATEVRPYLHLHCQPAHSSS